MVGIEISTGIKLDNGKVVKGYYLDEEGYNRLFNAGDIDGRFKGVWDTLEKTLNSMHRMQEILKTQLVANCKNQMLTWLQEHSPEKSVKEWNFWVQFEKEGFGWEVLRLAFMLLVKEGKIDRRGKSNWYRLHQEPKKDE